MSKVAVVYWSGTGNTEAMANAVADGAKAKGAEVSILGPSELKKDDVAQYDGLAFGCPSMGAEVLEESEFQPMWDDVCSALAGKKVVLFGSYGWGDGEWLRNWASEAGVDEGTCTYMCNETPDDDALKACQDLGASIA